MFRHHGTAAGVGTLALTAALIAAPAIALAAEDDPGSFAEGRFLSGTLLQADLGGVVSLDSAIAINDGSSPVSEERNPFSATALGEVTVDPGTVEVSDADGVDVGVIGQYAVARDNGTSYASSGLIGPNGAIGVSPAPGAVAVIDLGMLLGDALPAAIAGLRIETSEIAAEAEATLGEYRGDYTLADARLVLDIPAVAAADDDAQAAMVPLQQELISLGTSSGPLASVVQDLFASLGLGGLADVSVSVDADLDGVLAGMRDIVLRDDALSVDLATGIVTVDLASLPEGNGLNALEPGADLLSGGVMDDIADGVGRLLDGYLDDLNLRIASAIQDAHITVDAHASVLDDVQTGEIVRTITTPVTQVIDAATGQVLGILDPGTGDVKSVVPAFPGDVLADLLIGVGPLSILGVVPSVTTQVVAEVSTVTEPAFSTLETSVDVAIAATLAGLRGGTVTGASATASLLGAPVAIDAAVIVDGLAEALNSALPSGAAGGGNDATGEASTPLAEVADLADLVALRANVQSIGADGAFTQTALRVEVLGGDLATIDLANATVGPNAVPGGTGGGEEPDPTFAAEGELAFTGFTFGLIALIGAAFIALGAYALWRSRALAAMTHTEVGS